MKSIIKKITVIAFTLGAFTLHASDIEIVSRSKSTLTILFDDIKKGDQWFVRNSKGKEILKGQFKSENSDYFEFDVQNFKLGNYTVEIDKDYHTVVLNFAVTDEGFTYDDSISKTVFKPLIEAEGKKLKVSKFSPEEEEVKIILYFEGEVIYRERANYQNLLKRIINLSDEVEGEYKVIVRTGYRVYKEKFSL